MRFWPFRLSPREEKRRRLGHIQTRLHDIHWELERSEDMFTRKRLQTEMDDLIEERRDLFRGNSQYD